MSNKIQLVIISVIVVDYSKMCQVKCWSVYSRSPYTGASGPPPGHWFFPNGTTVPNMGDQWEFYRTRGRMMVLMHHRRGGVAGAYCCEIPDQN